jgi:hypothetical protein
MHLMTEPTREQLMSDRRDEHPDNESNDPQSASDVDLSWVQMGEIKEDEHPELK